MIILLIIETAKDDIGREYSTHEEGRVAEFWWECEKEALRKDNLQVDRSIQSNNSLNQVEGNGRNWICMAEVETIAGPL
jgi:hypothetical protein